MAGLMLAAPVLLPGCASIVTGRTQEITVNTNPQGARCQLTRENGVIAVVPRTPGTVRIDRAKAPIQVSCEKAGHGDTTNLVDSEIEQMVFGNIVIGGLLGWGIDSAIGADNKYDSTVNITLLPAPPAGDKAVAAVGPAGGGGAKSSPPSSRQVAQAGDISQANWAAERTAYYTPQTNTIPVDYKPPPKAEEDKNTGKAAMASAGEPLPLKPGVSAASRMAPKGADQAAAPTASPAASLAASQAASPPPPLRKTAPVAMASAGSTLPAGYQPSAAAADAAGAKADMKTVAASPIIPEVTGRMADKPAADGLWRVHLASHRTEWAAISEWQELLKQNPKLYGQFDPRIEWVDLKDRGSFARLLAGGWADRKEADAACAKIRGPRRYCAVMKD